MSRKTARQAAVQMVFESLFGGDGGDDTLTGLISFEPAEGDMEYVQSVVNGVREHGEEIDGIIAGHLKNWTLDRISNVSHAAMKVANYEMKWQKDAPPGVIIREAVQLTQRFDEDSEGRFVNGVLSSVLKEMAPEGSQ